MKEYRFELHKLTSEHDFQIRGVNCMASNVTNVALLVTYYDNGVGYQETILSLQLPDGKEYCSGERVTIRFQDSGTNAIKSKRIQVNAILTPLLDKFYAAEHERFPFMIWPGSVTIALNDYIDQFCEWLIKEVFCVNEKESEMAKNVKKTEKVDVKGVTGFVLVWGLPDDEYDDNAKFFTSREQVLDYVEETANFDFWGEDDNDDGYIEPFVIDLSTMTQHPLIKSKVTF